MADQREFLQEVQRAAGGTPYVVSKTGNGFDVTLDIVDEQWFGLFHKEALKRVYIHHVELADDDTYTAGPRRSGWSSP